MRGCEIFAGDEARWTGYDGARRRKRGGMRWGNRARFRLRRGEWLALARYLISSSSVKSPAVSASHVDVSMV